MVQPYYAQRKLPAEVGAAKLDYPGFHAGREQAAIAEFGRAFGAVGALAEKRMNAIVQTEFTSGKADWETAHNVFLDDLRDDPDYENYSKKYNAYSKKIQKDILGTKSPIAKKILSEMFKSKTPSVEKSISNIAWERKSGAMVAETLNSVRKFELAGNSGAAEAALIEAVSAGTIDAKEAAGRAIQIKRNIDWNNGYRLTESDPAGLLEILDKGVFEHLDKQDIEQLRTRAESTLAAESRIEAAQLVELQKETGRQRLADFWDNKLTDPQVITDDLRDNRISLENAKYLRDAMLNPKPPKTDLLAYAEVLRAKTDVGRGAKTVNQALDVVYKNTERLDPATGKSLVNDIFGEHDKHDADMEKEGRDLMEELIREKDPVSGMFTDNAREIIGTAEALIELDASIKRAAEAGKPLTGKELLIESIRIGRLKSRNIKGEEIPGFLYTNPSFYGELLKGIVELPEGERAKIFEDEKTESKARTEIYSMWTAFTENTQEIIRKGYLAGKPLKKIMEENADVAADVKSAIKKNKNPYPKLYPDAFIEDGVWKVFRGGNKYRIEE